MDHTQCFLFIVYSDDIEVLKELRKPYHNSILKGYVLLHEYVLDGHNYYDASDFFSEFKVQTLEIGQDYPSLFAAIQQNKCEVMEFHLKQDGGGLRDGTAPNEYILHVFGEAENRAYFKKLLPRRTVYHSPQKYRSKLAPRYLVADGEENIKILKQLLAHGANIGFRHRNGGSFLHLAFNGCDEFLASLLLQYGANVNARDALGETCLHKTIFGPSHYDYCFRRSNHLGFASLTLRNNADVNIGDNKGTTALHKAIELNEWDYFELILNSSSPNLELSDHYGYTPLHKASVRGRQKMVTCLLQRGANVNAPATDSTSFKFKNATPLHLATRTGHLATMKALLENGADVNAVGFNECSPLMLAIKLIAIDAQDTFGFEGTNMFRHVDDVYGRLSEFVKLILLHRPSLDSESNKAAFCFAMAVSSALIVDMLMDYGFTIDAELVNNEFLFHGVISRNDIKLVEKLLALGADVNSPFNQKSNGFFYSARFLDRPLHTAVRKADDDIVGQLLKNGADVNGKTTKGETPLMCAIQRSRFSTVKILSTFGANIHIADKTGITALHLASAGGLSEVVDYLLKNGADVNVHCCNGKTPIFNSVEKNHELTTALLIKQGARIDLKDESGTTLLHITASPSIVELLVQSGLDVNTTNGSEESPLFTAAKRGMLNVVEVLMKYGARVDKRNKDDLTPLNVVVRSFWQDMISSDSCVDVLKFMLEYDFKNVELASDVDMAEDGWDSNHYDYYDSDYYFNKITTVIVRHVVKLTSLGLSVSQNKFDDFPSFSDITEGMFPYECAAEVSHMKIERVGNSEVTFYDFATKDLFLVSCYLRNSSVVQALDSAAYESMFPIYASIIKSQFIKGAQRRELLNQGVKIFHLIFCEFSQLPLDLKEQIINYLTNQEIVFMIHASKTTL